MGADRVVLGGPSRVEAEVPIPSERPSSSTPLGIVGAELTDSAVDDVWREPTLPPNLSQFQGLLATGSHRRSKGRPKGSKDSTPRKLRGTGKSNEAAVPKKRGRPLGKKDSRPRLARRFEGPVRCSSVALSDSILSATGMQFGLLADRTDAHRAVR